MAPRLFDFEDMYVHSNNDVYVNGKSTVEAVEVGLNNTNKTSKQDKHNGERFSVSRGENKNISNPIISRSMHYKKPLHKANFGGPRSSFVPIVRVPSKEVVGVINNQSMTSARRGSEKAYKTSNESQPSQSHAKFSKLLNGWQSRDKKITNNTKPQSQTIDYRFRPIISEDEKHQMTTAQSQLKPKELKKKKIYKIPVVEICFYDDESFGTISSMGYDGSEHDIEAIFKDAYMYPAHFDAREPDDMDNGMYCLLIISTSCVIKKFTNFVSPAIDFYIERNGHTFESRQSDEEDDLYNGIILKQIEDNVDKSASDKGNKIVDAIVQDPDLSIAHSTIQQKSVLDKDPDISIDGDEQNTHSVRLEGNGENNSKPDDMYKDTIIGDSKSFEKEKSSKETLHANSPPPLSEISIPISHDYGYGFYVTPLWNIDNRKTQATCTDRLQKVKNLLNEGKKRRKQKDLKRLVRRISIRTE